jgi:hypothetical protein
MATGEVPNDKEQVLAALSEMEAAHRARQERQSEGCQPDSGAPGRSGAAGCGRSMGDIDPISADFVEKRMRYASNMEQRDINPLDDIGTPAEIWSELMDFTRSAQILSESTASLMDEYSEQWVAVFGGQVASCAASFRDVLEKVDAKNLPRDKIIVRYIDKEPKTMIL